MTIIALPSVAQVDSNAAAFEGVEFTYIFYPPKGFVAISDEAIDAGYSLAYIPEGQSYDSADITIDINIFHLKDTKADKAFMTELIKDDLLKVKSHFGQNLIMRQVDSVTNAGGFPLITIYFNDTTRFIPTVMMSYFNGISEIVIFELSISKKQPRFKAEQVFTDCISAFKSLKSGDIEERNERQRKSGK